MIFMSEPTQQRKHDRIACEIHSSVPGARIRKQFLLNTVQAGARKLGTRISRVDFVLVDDRRMSKLHRDFSGVPGTTDVLTFDLSENGAVEGEVYICLDQARRQAREYQVPLYEECARLAVHGVLHLAGYSDHTERERGVMHKLENAALAAARRRA